MKTTLLLQLAGVLQLGLLTAGAAMPRAVRLREALASLPSFHRRLFWVYYGFIGLHLAGFGVLTLALAEPMAAGETVARALCGFLAVFWVGRMVVAALIFDLRPFLTTPLRRLGNHTLNVVFTYLAVLFTWIALFPETAAR